MREKKYQLVAWTKNINDKENARLHLIPSVELDLQEHLIKELNKCQMLLEANNGHLTLKLARRFIRAYEQSARLDIRTGHIDCAIRFLLKAAEYCIREDDLNWAYYDSDLGQYSHFCGELRYEFERFCEEAVSLARKHGLQHILQEAGPKQTIELYLEDTQEERDLRRHLKEMSAWRP